MSVTENATPRMVAQPAAIVDKMLRAAFGLPAKNNDSPIDVLVLLSAKKLLAKNSSSRDVNRNSASPPIAKMTG
jgi:hypothetical protein